MKHFENLNVFLMMLFSNLLKDRIRYGVYSVIIFYKNWNNDKIVKDERAKGTENFASIISR